MADFDCKPSSRTAQPCITNRPWGQATPRGTACNAGGLSASSLCRPYQVVLVGDGTDAGTKILVSDTGNHRVLIWNSWPAVNKKAADRVLGQGNFTTNAAALTQSGMNTPIGVWSNGTKTLVADYANHRVLLWNAWPTTNGALASAVLGQVDFISNAAACTLNGLGQPVGVWSNGTRVVVSQASYHRTSVWNSWPVTNASATFILGQANATTCTANRGGSAAINTLNVPYLVGGTGTKVAIADYGNHRVLIWNNPSSTGQNADVVLGQPNGTTTTPHNQWNTFQGLINPRSAFFTANNELIVTSNDGWVAVWNRHPTSHFEPYDYRIGKSDVTRPSIRPVSGTSFLGHVTAIVAEGKVLVSEPLRNRILVWNTLPAASQTAPDVVLGQSDFTGGLSNAGGAVDGSTLSVAREMAFDGSRLYVSDFGNNRVLIWNAIPGSHKATADIALGQTGLSLGVANAGGSSASTLNGPRGVVVYDGKLIVADQNNNRVLVWNNLPTSHGAPADVVVGQADLVSHFPNRGGAPSASGLNLPVGVAVDEAGRLYVSDNGNNRVLIWNAIPTSHGTPADVVLGQPDFASSTLTNGGLSASSLGYPLSVSTFDGKVFVWDHDNARILWWAQGILANNEAAAGALGRESPMAYHPPLPSATGHTGAGTPFFAEGIFVHPDRDFLRVLLRYGLPPL